MPQLHVLNNQRAGPGRGGISGTGGAVRPDVEALAADLAAVVELGEVRFGDHDRMLYSTDASLYQVPPLGVVVPGSTDEAERVVRWCVGRDVPILPRGGGTSLAGQCTNRAVVLDLTPRCRAIRWLDVAGRACEVEPGIGVDELNERLATKKTGLFFAPDPATTRQAAVGGCLGNNAAGARSIRYGRTSENIERLDVVLGTGERLSLGPDAGRESAAARRLGEGVLKIVRASAREIRERFPRTIRRNAGYGLDMILAQAEAGATGETVDLAKLLCGSEGTLAVTLGARLKLRPTPTAKGLMVISFATLEDAIAATKPILDAGLPLGLTAVELLDDVVLDAARGNIEHRRYVDLLPGASAERGEPKAALYVEFFGFDGGLSEVRAGFEAINRLMKALPGVLPDGVAMYTDAGAMLKAWSLRKAGEPLLHGLPGARKPITFVEDNAVPVERLGEFVREFKKIVGRHGTRAAYWAHASVGVLHVRPMIDLHDPADRERMIAIAVEVADLARECGGIMSGEHGDGRVRGPLLDRFFGPELMRAFREVKALFDPKGLLNPGNIVGAGPVESLAANLRVDCGEQGGRRDSRESSIATYFDYADADGFDHAVEQCNGAGVCRKRGGVMCPSYQATLDERHSTRGRGNALRLAVTGQFPWHRLPADGPWSSTPNWSDAETIKTLDLCLSCKACKSECPSNVDIARLKAEYTAQRYRATGSAPLKARVFGHVRALNRIGSIAPGLANWFNRRFLTKRLVERTLGIDARRSLPEFARPLHGQVESGGNPAAPRVVLFADCFTTFNEPQVGVAAHRVLSVLGYHVELLPGRADASGCCGRAMISMGLLDDAIQTADRTLALLRPAIDDPKTAAILVCEPSCLSAFADDWRQLRLRTPMDVRERLAAKAMLVEDFVERHWDHHPRRPTIRDDTRPVILHGHCHQKSLWGIDTSARLLRRLSGDRLRVLDTGCCGMAGSFGFTRERYELSMRIGEMNGAGVLPLVREAPGDAAIVAPGTSCRHQIYDGAARRAMHPIELAADLIR
ncbi:MAG: FAD-binding protein [Phycisphaerales bacterium]|nr:FAD-binding protein [Phycisphaerales bacterium]